MATQYRENMGSVFLWGIVACAVLAIIVYMIG